jgi:hypothetical protein
LCCDFMHRNEFGSVAGTNCCEHRKTRLTLTANPRTLGGMFRRSRCAGTFAAVDDRGGLERTLRISGKFLIHRFID